MDLMMLGAIAFAHFSIGLYFLRFWKQTRDVFFLAFALSFGVEGVNRVVMGLLMDLTELHPVVYGIRFVSYLLIVVAILQKNRAAPTAQ